jgi:hypothetical protein
VLLLCIGMARAVAETLLTTANVLTRNSDNSRSCRKMGASQWERTATGTSAPICASRRAKKACANVSANIPYAKSPCRAQLRTWLRHVVAPLGQASSCTLSPDWPAFKRAHGWLATVANCERRTPVFKLGLDLRLWLVPLPPTIRTCARRNPKLTMVCVCVTCAEDAFTQMLEFTSNL